MTIFIRLMAIFVGVCVSMKQNKKKNFFHVMKYKVLPFLHSKQKKQSIESGTREKFLRFYQFNC